MIIQIRIVGLGGQGIVLLGQIIGQAGVYDKRHVAQSSTYGPETRGSLCRSEVVMSDAPIDYPYAVKSDVLVAMTQQGLDTFANSVAEPDGRIFYDTRLVQQPQTRATAEYLPVPATDTALKHYGSPTAANIIMLGAVVSAAEIVSPASIIKAIKETIKPKSLPTNIEAFNLGIGLAPRG